MEMGRIQTILGPDRNRRFNCADDADHTDAKEPTVQRKKDPRARASSAITNPSQFASGLRRANSQCRSAVSIPARLTESGTSS